jgi:hypothetical protein
MFKYYDYVFQKDIEKLAVNIAENNINIDLFCEKFIFGINKRNDFEIALKEAVESSLVDDPITRRINLELKLKDLAVDLQRRGFKLDISKAIYEIDKQVSDIFDRGEQAVREKKNNAPAPAPAPAPKIKTGKNKPGAFSRFLSNIWRKKA